MNNTVEQIIIDTDPGDDDVASMLWAIASEKFNILGITVTNGNVDVDKCVTNALRAVEVSGRVDIPVYRGAHKPLVRPTIEATWIHGEDGLGDLGYALPNIEPAPGFAPVEMIRMAKESRDRVTILALGPLTNIALAILLDKEFIHTVERIIFMGGVVRFSGNQAPRASYNVKVDPEAARIVYNSGIPVVQIGLDVCNLVTQRVEDLDRIVEANTRVSRFLIEILKFRRDHAVQVIKDRNGKVVNKIKASQQVSSRRDGIGLNDLTATGYLINPEWFKTVYTTIDIQTSGICDGETIVDYKNLWNRKANAYYAFDVDGPSLVAQWVKDMSSYLPQ